MKPALLDVNVLMALAWPSHIHHEAAHEWFTKEQQYGWATCPITQAALVRLSSNPKIIADAVSPKQAIALLEQITKLEFHQFWADNVSLTEASIFKEGYIVGHRQITDAYLLALAMQHNGRLVSFDKAIGTYYPKEADKHLSILQGHIG